MGKNIGGSEKGIRFVLGIIGIVIGAMGFGLEVSFLAYLIGVYLLLTALISWCPIYSLFNYSSKGGGIDKISRRDIEEAIKSYSVPESRPVTKAVVKSSPVKKPVVKKKTVSKKKVVKKPAQKKSFTKKVVKKTSAKKKSSVVKKKTAAKKPVKKKTLTKKKK